MTYDEIRRLARVVAALDAEKIQLLLDYRLSQLIDSTMLLIIATYLYERMGYSELREQLKELIAMRERINERRNPDQTTDRKTRVAEGEETQQETTEHKAS
jgi:hypothetical protein